jgi:hypothetical protein
MDLGICGRKAVVCVDSWGFIRGHKLLLDGVAFKSSIV